MSPFSDKREETVSVLGEKALIKAIQAWTQPIGLAAPEGIGDDCALIHIEQPGKHLLTTDGVIYGSHFDHTAAADLAGEKLIKRNISDIAAMGGTPQSALVSIITSSHLKTNWLKNFYQGIIRVAKRYGIHLIGGDVAEGPKDYFSGHMTLMGKVKKPILRQHAEIGDSLWVTGTLGGSILGHHLNFQPRLDEGKWLAEHGRVTAMIDITDGLAKDLPTLLQNKQVALLELDGIPICEAAYELAKQTGKPPVEHAFCDGEDYELLFTLRESVELNAFKRAWEKQFKTQVQCIGRIQESGEKHSLLNAKTGKPLPTWYGFEHISS
tara:strand:+ start:2065 stop:3036 length:972 start_codon:yes stop_codon:yes gene_type:complete